MVACSAFGLLQFCVVSACTHWCVVCSTIGSCMVSVIQLTSQYSMHVRPQFCFSALLSGAACWGLYWCVAVGCSDRDFPFVMSNVFASASRDRTCTAHHFLAWGPFLFIGDPCTWKFKQRWTTRRTHPPLMHCYEVVQSRNLVIIRLFLYCGFLFNGSTLMLGLNSDHDYGSFPVTKNSGLTAILVLLFRSFPWVFGY